MHFRTITLICQTAGNWHNAAPMETLRSPLGCVVETHPCEQSSDQPNNTPYTVGLVFLFLKERKLRCCLPGLVSDLFPREPCCEPWPIQNDPPVPEERLTLSTLQTCQEGGCGWDTVSCKEPIQTKKGQFQGEGRFKGSDSANGKISVLSVSPPSQSILSCPAWQPEQHSRAHGCPASYPLLFIGQQAQ